MSKIPISYFTEDISFKLKNEKDISFWIKNTIKKEHKQLGEISFIFCSDNYLHQINLSYLNHDTYTDIITFNYNEETTISGDIFISIERVTENANKFNVLFDNELKRVMIHGILHLLDYNDKTPNQQKEMKTKEDFYLSSTLHNL